MRISIFGSGYVGLVQAAVFSEVGHQVTCMDIDAERIAQIETGELPFFEPGLADRVTTGLAQVRCALPATPSLLLKAVITSLSALVHPLLRTAAQTCSTSCQRQKPLAPTWTVAR